MENLTRKEQKIFAVNNTSNQVSVFGSKAQTGTMTFSDDPDVIQGNNWENGWGSAVITNSAPFQEDFNAISYVNSYNIAYLFQKGIPEWSANTAYYKGSIVMVLNSGIPSIYYSGQDNNELNPNDGGWVKIPFSELPNILNNKANINLDNITEDGENVIKNVVSGSYADIDLSNTTPSQTFKDNSISWGIPDYSAGIEMGLSSSNRTFTAPSDGVCIIALDVSSVKLTTFVNGNPVSVSVTSVSQQYIPVSKDDVLTLGTQLIDVFDLSIFYPFKGVNNA